MAERKERDITNLVNNVLWFALLVLVLFAWYDGQFVKKEPVYINICSFDDVIDPLTGEVVNPNGITRIPAPTEIGRYAEDASKS